MKRYNSNLHARHIVLSEDDKHMVSSITVRKLKELPVYKHLPSDVQNILRTNVLIVATTDSVKRLDDKVDIIIGNIDDAIKLVMDDVRSNSHEVLES